MFSTLVSQKKNVAGRLLLSMLLLTLEFGSDVVLSCDPHTCLSTLLSGLPQPPVPLCVTLLFCGESTSHKLQSLLSFIPPKCFAVSYVLGRVKPGVLASAPVLTKTPYPSVPVLLGASLMC